MAFNRRTVVGRITSILIGAIGMSSAACQINTIHLPDGGKVSFGRVNSQTTEAGAMGAVLRTIHNEYGDRPKVGRLFQVRGTESVAAFFSVTKQTQGGGQWAGMIIAAKASDADVEVAVVSDDATRFPQTLAPMMKTLLAQWHPLADGGDAAVQANAHGSNGSQHEQNPPVQQMREVTLPDRSASAELPVDWHVSPQSGGGTIIATGPHDEIASLGLMLLAEDTNNPRVQQLMRTVQAGGLRNTVYAQAFYYPWGGDLERSFEAVFRTSGRNWARPLRDTTSQA